LFLSDAQILPSIGLKTTGQTSRQVTNANRLILPGGAHYEIVDVMVTDPDTGDSFINAADGFVHFTVRSNTTPTPLISASFAEYQIISADPNNAQSTISFDELLLPSAYNGKNVRVKYETVVSLDVIHAFTRDRFERVLSGNILVKGFHPVYLSMNVQYKRKATLTGAVDELGLRQAIADFINSFDPRDVIDTSDISQVAREFSTLIGTVYPITITYELIVPDGRLIHYSTVDTVSITSDKLVSGYTNSTLTNPVSLGLSDRTIRYMTTLARITVEDLT
jgi:hypothetical protein